MVIWKVTTSTRRKCVTWVRDSTSDEPLKQITYLKLSQTMLRLCNRRHLHSLFKDPSHRCYVTLNSFQKDFSQRELHVLRINLKKLFDVSEWLWISLSKNTSWEKIVFEWVLFNALCLMNYNSDFDKNFTMRYNWH